MRELDWGIGKPVPRSEDARLIAGLGRYSDDVDLGPAAALYLVRSPHAAARIVGIDVAAAKNADGVLAVLTGADVVAAELGTLPSRVQRHKANGEPNFVPPYYPLAVDVAPHSGVAVVAVVAESLAQAKDAAELVEIDYEVLPAVTDTGHCLDADAPVVWDGQGDNRCFVLRLGAAAAADDAFEHAEHVVRDRLVITRMTTNSIEPRNALGNYTAKDGRYALYSSLQSPHTIQREIAAIFREPANRFRVVAHDVGGSFGMKGSVYPEQVLVLWASRLTGRPVKWVAERSEGFLSDHQARDNISDVALALDKDGRFLALRVETMANIGAYIALNGLHSSTNNLGGLAGVYRIPAFDVAVTGVFSHTPPTCPFRGAGRPEASYCIERIIDLAARKLQLDPAELRRRNLIPANAMPYKTGLVYTYDCGDFEAVMDRCLEAADWKGFDKRRRDSEARGLLRGIGIACVIEIAGGPQGMPMEEAVEIRFDSGGSCTVVSGSHSHGQGHETVLKQFAAQYLGLAPDQVRVVSGDTDEVAHGRGSFGSRTMMAAGTAFATAAQRVIDRGNKIAAHLLEVGEGDVDFADGFFNVAGTDLKIALPDVARASYLPARMPRNAEFGLDAKAIVTPRDATFPNGCHICEVEIDPDTGVTRILAYTVVDDVGNVMNPLLLKGQLHGGIAQGVGQALMERIAYADGQLVTGSFMDYGMPRATHLPFFDVVSHAVPTATNPLGAKGAGEAGTVGALPAVMNAVADALYRQGVPRIDMPATPGNVWSALQGAKRK
ncbi:MAG: xanthine dehydrogenase family protein molybdopterin-binding subunit [Pseudolabrys sp.]|nr:xanthine dehydrogenase family protein molybdopterin-binding subunit [Pseudolabrys sp.]